MTNRHAYAYEPRYGNTSPLPKGWQSASPRYVIDLSSGRVRRTLHPGWNQLYIIDAASLGSRYS